jgi:tetratricopeptide (TPR) repeat protein
MQGAIFVTKTGVFVFCDARLIDKLESDLLGQTTARTSSQLLRIFIGQAGSHVETELRKVLHKDYGLLGLLILMFICPATVSLAQLRLSNVIGPGTDHHERAAPVAAVKVENSALNASGGDASNRNSGNNEIQQHFLSAKSYQQQQRLLEAMVEYQEVLRLEPQNERASISLAMLLSQMGRKAEAENVCRDQLLRYPALIKLHLTLASLLIPDQRYQEAGREIQTFFEAAGSIVEVAYERTYGFYLQGVNLIAQKQEEEGVQRLLEVVKRDPGFVEAHMELAEFYSQSGQTYEKAVEHLTQVLELKSELAAAQRAVVHEKLGKVLLSLERIQPAIEHLQKSIELSSSSSLAYFDLAKAYRKLGEADKAKEILSRFEALYSEKQIQMEKRKRALALYQEGERQGSQGKLDEALKAFHECQQLAPERSQFDSIFPPDRAYYGLAFVNLSLGNFQLARKNIERAIELYPYDPRYYEAYSISLKTLGDRLTAIIMIKKAIQLNPVAHNYHNLLGNLCSEADKYQEAVSAYRRATELDPQNPNYRLNLSSALFKLGGYAESQKENDIYLKLISQGQK